MSILKKAIRKVFPSKQARRVRPWFAVNGDKTLRLNYDLNDKSIVFDLGGYEGQWASDIFSKYRCTVYVFEPFIRYANAIKDRFKQNPSIKVFDFGLGKDDSTFKIYEDNDATSVFNKSGEPTDIAIRKASAFIKSSGVSGIDLMKINIEGGEYDLLEELIESGLIKIVRNIQVQFHDFVPNAEARMKGIQEKLGATHELSYQFTFVWENWRLKNSR